MGDIEAATKEATQATIHHALTTSEQDATTQVNATTTQPRMIGTKEINKESAKDATTKELKQMVEGGASDDTEDWPKALRNHHVKHANYIVVKDTVLINGKAIIPAKPNTSCSPRSHGCINGLRARAGEAMFLP